jgi:mRNA degradation ribonuclease J1/J2
MAKMIKESATDFPISILEEFSNSPIFVLDSLEHVFESNALVILSYFEIFELIRKLDSTEITSKRITSILTEPESGKEEIFEYSIMSRWLSLYGIHPYRIRVSGHYYPFELGEILRACKFKKLIPIHTEHPEILLQYARYFSK